MDRHARTALKGGPLSGRRARPRSAAPSSFERYARIAGRILGPQLIVALEDELRDRLIGSFRDPVAVTVVGAASSPRNLVGWRGPFDVAVVAVERLDATVHPLLTNPLMGYPEVVFVVANAWSSQRFALESRGYQYVVPQTNLLSWLVGALEPLCAIARTRRQALDALARRPSAPAISHLRDRSDNPRLHAAETSFRDTYLRLLLVEQGSRRKAAAAAGIPYRSFCEMMRRAGI